jgi:hypothetical protein
LADSDAAAADLVPAVADFVCLCSVDREISHEGGQIQGRRQAGSQVSESICSIEYMTQGFV